MHTTVTDLQQSYTAMHTTQITMQQTQNTMKQTLDLHGELLAEILRRLPPSAAG